MNLPNILSLFRIIVALTVPFLVINGSLTVRLVAGSICFIAAITDLIDGWYARKYGLVTKIGKILDPIADKAFVIICLSVLAYLDVMSFWWIIPIILREVIITVYRLIFLERGAVVAAVRSGKIKTILQMLSIAVAYSMFMISRHAPSYFYDFYWIILYVILSLTILLTVQSGYIFFRNNWRLVKRVHNI